MASDEHRDELAIKTIRALTMDAVQKAQSGHPGTPMGLAPLGWVLFTRLRRHDPTYPQWADRDRFVLSCGHACMLQYSLLHLTGYDLSLDDIKQFRQWESRTPGHPEFHLTPGVETTTGPLGQGLGNAVGMAMAERHLATRFNQDDHTLFEHHTWVIASDGDMMEGIGSEAASLAGHLKLGKLIVFWDDNRITIDGSTDLTFSEKTLDRFASYGWHTQSVDDGDDLDALEKAAEAARQDPRPSFIRVRTVIGWPAPSKQNTAAAHGAPLGDDEVAKTKELLGWPAEPFYVPDELSEVRTRVADEGARSRQEWEQRLAQYRKAHPDDAASLQRALAGELPREWDADLPRFEADENGIATRKASGKVLQMLAERIPELVGGSADLTGSNNVRMDDYADFRPDSEGVGPPRNVWWGVREHAMGAAVNGMALHGGVVPFGATFLIFSDYMRPSIRLSAIMNMPSRFVYTHDSIGLGEDGPTHQPIEQLASLRAIPGLTVIRPADANEVRECWKMTLRCNGPAALVLTRQNVPIIDRSRYAPAEGAARGAYVIAEAEDGNPELIVIATGSEVPIALDAHERLKGEGIRARVVSMPSWEIFAEQDAAYREQVLPSDVSARVVVEAAVSFGWERWAGPRARYVTLEDFGASAPWKVLYQQLGITADRVVEQAKRARED